MPEIDFELPAPPWSMRDVPPSSAYPKGAEGFISRYGAEEAELIYCRIARTLRYFDPGSDASFRPDLDPTPHLETIRAQQAAKTTGGSE